MDGYISKDISVGGGVVSEYSNVRVSGWKKTVLVCGSE